MKVLFVLTSHDDLGDTGEKTGFWLEEFASPYYTLLDAGAQVTLASPEGGQPPVDPNSKQSEAETEATKRFHGDTTAQQELAHTIQLAEVNADEFDAVFYPGGHGPMWDLHNNQKSIELIVNFIAAGKPVASVCHAPAVLLKAKDTEGQPLVKGKQVTGFSNSEEQGVGLTDVVPYLLEDELKACGGQYQKGDDGESFIQTDGLLITGQNPASSQAVAEALIKKLA